jgi:hypothetical protein
VTIGDANPALQYRTRAEAHQRIGIRASHDAIDVLDNTVSDFSGVLI